MSLIDFAAPQAAAQATRGRTQRFNADGTPRAEAKLWLNVGITLPNGKFVNLPMGLPIDTMEPVDVRGQNEDWVKLQNTRNALLKSLQGIPLTAGEEQALPKMEVRIRRVNEALQVAADDDFTIDFAALFAPAPTLEAAE